MSGCNPAVVELVKYLKNTGTGQPKLDALLKLGEKCGDDKLEFLLQAKAVVPEGTMKKIKEYVTSRDTSYKMPDVLNAAPLETVSEEATPTVSDTPTASPATNELPPPKEVKHSGKSGKK